MDLAHIGVRSVLCLGKTLILLLTTVEVELVVVVVLIVVVLVVSEILSQCLVDVVDCSSCAVLVVSGSLGLLPSSVAGRLSDCG